VPSNLVSPILWQVIPFKDPDAWSSFLGDHDQWHQILGRATGAGWQPVDDLREKGGLLAHQTMHNDLADALNIPRPGDLVSYDLKKKDEFTGWNWLHSLDHLRLQSVTGL